MDSPEHSFPSHQELFSESLPSPESPNQPFHDLLHRFAQEILHEVEQSMHATGLPAYLLDTQIKYERHIDELLAGRDRQGGGQ